MLHLCKEFYSKRLYHHHSDPLSFYSFLVETKGFKRDPNQIRTVELLNALHQQLVKYPEPPIKTYSPFNSFLSASFSGLFNKRPPNGLYLWGDVGSGKTMLMDLFYDTLPIKRKRRIHFHAFMADVHKRVHNSRQLKMADPVAPVANELFNEAYVLCFDELQVTDIKDAMILRRLFEELIAKGCVIVTTSNRHPDELYKNGIQRASFIPAIELIKQNLKIHSLSGIDYRKEQKEKFSVFFHPLNSYSKGQMQEIWSRISKGKVEKRELKHLGRSFTINESSGDFCRFSFKELIEQPWAATDYLELCKHYKLVLLYNVPRMNLEKRNEARRFITLIDTLYENKTRLVMSADSTVNRLFTLDDNVMDEYLGGDALVPATSSASSNSDEEVFAFARTVSRLTEMQTEQWFGRDFYNMLVPSS